MKWKQMIILKFRILILISYASIAIFLGYKAYVKIDGFINKINDKTNTVNIHAEDS